MIRLLWALNITIYDKLISIYCPSLASKLTWQALKWAHPQTPQLRHCSCALHRTLAVLWPATWPLIFWWLRPCISTPFLSSHALQKQICAHLRVSSKNAITKAGKLLMMQNLGRTELCSGEGMGGGVSGVHGEAGLAWAGIQAHLDNSVPILIHCGHWWLKFWMILNLCMMRLTPHSASWATCRAHSVSMIISAASWILLQYGTWTAYNGGWANSLRVECQTHSKNKPTPLFKYICNH